MGEVRRRSGCRSHPGDAGIYPGALAQSIDLERRVYVLYPVVRPLRPQYDLLLPSGRWRSRECDLGLGHRLADHPVCGRISGRDHVGLSHGGRSLLPDIYPVTALVSSRRLMDLRMGVCGRQHHHYPRCQLWNYTLLCRLSGCLYLRRWDRHHR